MRRPESELVIRPAYPDDAPALARLAELDESEIPAGPVLLGEVAGELWAAVSMGDLRHISHPFRPSGEIVELLRHRARQLCGGAGRNRRLGSRLALLVPTPRAVRSPSAR